MPLAGPTTYSISILVSKNRGITLFNPFPLKNRETDHTICRRFQSAKSGHALFADDESAFLPIY